MHINAWTLSSVIDNNKFLPFSKHSENLRKKEEKWTNFGKTFTCRVLNFRPASLSQINKCNKLKLLRFALAKTIYEQNWPRKHHSLAVTWLLLLAGDSIEHLAIISGLRGAVVFGD